MEKENERKAELEVRGIYQRQVIATSIASEHKKYLVSICDGVP